MVLLISSTPWKKVAYLGGEVEAQVAVVGQRILNKQWHFAGKAELDLCRKAGSLAEVDEVLEGEREGNRLRKIDLDVVFGLLNVAMGAQRYGSGANVACGRKFNTFFGAFNPH